MKKNKGSKKSENRKHHLGKWTMQELKESGGRGFPLRLCSRRNGEQGECQLGPFLPSAIPTWALGPLLLIGPAFSNLDDWESKRFSEAGKVH